MNTYNASQIDTQINVQPVKEMLETAGMYGNYGGAYVPEVLASQLTKLAAFFDSEVQKSEFQRQFIHYLKTFVGRPSPLFKAENLSEAIGATIYLKREDLNHTGSHKINNAIGQILLAKQMGAKEVIAETGAGQHGVATATAAALLKIPCKVFMGAVDAERQLLNVKRMELLGTKVVITNEGRATLKDAVDAALGYYIENPESFYLLGSQVGPHPYPKMVGYFQSVIGNEAIQQIVRAEKRLPDAVFACLGGGSNAIGAFSAFLPETEVKLYGAEGGGKNVFNHTAATLTYGKPSVFQGTYSYCLVDEENNPMASESIAAGLDYPGISPQHASLKDSGRATYEPITDEEAQEAYRLLAKLEGIIPAIESSHAVALAIKKFKNTGKLAIVNLSGRGDKDITRDI
ncbi:tryptophan synthase subunit beta [Aequorivita viscosa]|uniref:Tryptophan synthase beta chain n=1 Tax=Aequorivita viscosa TaxID=797419 RepID=A0A1M6NIE6_9FLAO|nr:tryptophan synthase subunit beta [Aequorivita viscosa]SDX35666.1 tryptophan synthase, beta chain [Aequorivita viscosa]SHJ95394.1 tryptophan synthase, beta chain [Aequorivita viscosa]